MLTEMKKYIDNYKSFQIRRNFKKIFDVYGRNSVLHVKGIFEFIRSTR